MDRVMIKIDEEKMKDCDCMDLRCDCGSLVARLVSEGVEIKCRRCKRLVLITCDTEE